MCHLLHHYFIFFMFSKQFILFKYFHFHFLEYFSLYIFQYLILFKLEIIFYNQVLFFFIKLKMIDIIHLLLNLSLNRHPLFPLVIHQFLIQNFMKFLIIDLNY